MQNIGECMHVSLDNLDSAYHYLSMVLYKLARTGSVSTSYTDLFIVLFRQCMY